MNGNPSRLAAGVTLVTEEKEAPCAACCSLYRSCPAGRRAGRVRRRLGHRRAELDARRDRAREAVERRNDRPPARADAARRTALLGDDPQRRRRETFAAKPTGKPGVYRAAVVFPTAGKWSYEVDDGFISGQPHTFPPVQIGAPAPAPRRGGHDRRRRRPVARLAPIGGLALLAAAAGLLVFSRRGRHAPSAGGVRATTLAAGGLACAGAAMTIAAFAGGGSDPPTRTAPPPRRRASARAQVFAEQGCGSCHTFAPASSSAPIGPDLTHSLQGRSRDYVIESIVLPNKVAAPGYGDRRDARGLRATNRAAGPRSTGRFPHARVGR